MGKGSKPRRQQEPQERDRRQSPAHRLMNLLHQLRRKYNARVFLPVEAAQRRTRAQRRHLSLLANLPANEEFDVYVQRLASAYERLKFDPKAQGAVEQARIWTQECLSIGSSAPEIWKLNYEEEFSLLQLLECSLQARMDGEVTMEEVALCPAEQISRLLKWRCCALSLCEEGHKDAWLQQRHSSEWKRFGVELVGALEMGRGRDAWKTQSARWLAIVADLVRFSELHVHLLWRGEINGFAVLALLRNWPQRLAPALARVLPNLQSSLARKYSCNYERSVVAILRSGHAAAIEEISEKLLEGLTFALCPSCPAHKWMLRVQTHLVRFACEAGTKVVHTWLNFEDSILEAVLVTQETQTFLKQLLSTDTSIFYPELYASQQLLAAKLMSLAPLKSEIRRKLLGQGQGLSRLELLIAKHLRELRPPLPPDEVDEGKEHGQQSRQQLLLSMELRQLRLKIKKQEMELSAQPCRMEILDFVVNHGRDFTDLPLTMCLLPEDPLEESGPLKEEEGTQHWQQRRKWASSSSSSTDAILKAAALLCGEAPTFGESQGSGDAVHLPSCEKSTPPVFFVKTANAKEGSKTETSEKKDTAERAPEEQQQQEENSSVVMPNTTTTWSSSSFSSSYGTTMTPPQTGYDDSFSPAASSSSISLPAATSYCSSMHGPGLDGFYMLGQGPADGPPNQYYCCWRVMMMPVITAPVAVQQQEQQELGASTSL